MSKGFLLPILAGYQYFSLTYFLVLGGVHPPFFMQKKIKIFCASNIISLTFVL